MDYNAWLIDQWNTRMVPFLYSDDWIRNVRRILTWSYTLSTSEAVVDFGVETYAMNKADAVEERWNRMRTGIQEDFFDPSLDILHKSVVFAWLGSLLQMGWNFTQYGMDTVIEMATGQLDSFDVSGTKAADNNKYEN